jgi:hypothetical protein
MFEKSFTFTVLTDAEGRFEATKLVTSPLSLDVKIGATLHSPLGTTIRASFGIAPAAGPPSEEFPFAAATGETVDLGKWRVVAGDDANTATARGYTEPPAAYTEVQVEFIAAPSFF